MTLQGNLFTRIGAFVGLPDRFDFRQFRLLPVGSRQDHVKVQALDSRAGAGWSSGMIGARGQDPLNQLLQLRAFASQQCWDVMREYTDEASAKNGDRKGFKALFADAARHRFDVLLFWSLDRLTREGTFKTHCYLRQLSDCGVKFKSFTEQYVDSLGVFGDAIIGLLAWCVFQKAASKAGIGKLATHTMRHSYRSWLDAVGTAIAVQQKLMRMHPSPPR